MIDTVIVFAWPIEHWDEAIVPQRSCNNNSEVENGVWNVWIISNYLFKDFVNFKEKFENIEKGENNSLYIDLIISVPPGRVQFSHSSVEREGTTEVTCSANNIYPSPAARIYWKEG